jgi:hypothetical protein
MWTLTVDQAKYQDAEHAYDEIRRKEKVSKLCRKMGWKYTVTVLEWNQDGGWPHWHLLVWQPVRPGQRMFTCKHEAQKAWGGILHYSPSRGRKPVLAVNYITKYITKADAHPAPEWTLDRSNIRTISSSRAWGPTITHQRRSERMEAPQGTAESRHPRNNREAIAECGTQTVVMREFMDQETGEIKCQFVARLNLDFRTVRGFMYRKSNLAKRTWAKLWGSFDVNKNGPGGEALRGLIDSYNIET